MFAIFSAGCGKRPVLKSQHTVTDTVMVEKTIIERDTVIITPPAETTVIFDCDSLLKAASNPLQNSFENASITIKPLPNGKIEAICLCDTLAIEATLRDRFEKTERFRNENKVTEVPVKFIPDWVRYLAIFGGICALLIVLKILLTIYKP